MVIRTKNIAVSLIACVLIFSKQSSERSKPEVILSEDKRQIIAGENDFWTNKYVYIIEGDIVIERGGRLVIEPGTTVKFHPKFDIDKSGKEPLKSEIFVHGELIAEGEPGSEGMIIFTSYDDIEDRRAGDWYGITIFKNRDNKESRIINCRIEYATSAINIVGSNPLIINNWINYNLENAIYVSALSEAVIAFNQIYDNVYTGLDIRYKGKPKVYSNLIYRNKFGIMIFDSSNPQLGDRNKREVIIGENVLKGENILSGNNVFYENERYDIYSNSISNISAENNSWDGLASSKTTQDIENRIFDRKDKSSVGEIDFNPIRSKYKIEEKYIRRTQIEDQILAMKDQKSRVNQFLNKLNIRSTPNLAVGTDKTAANVDSVDAVVADSLDQELTALNASISSQMTKNDPMPDIYLDPGSGEVINPPEPVYTGQARTLGIIGLVKLKIIVDVNGKVKNAHVIYSDHTSLNQLAINDAVKMSFAIGYYKGQRVHFTTSVIIDYHNQQTQPVSN